MGLSCGNPTAFVTLQPGEVVADLGCGGGLDVFLAAQKVGPSGKAIGIDMTLQIEEYRQGLVGAGFVHAQIIDSGADLNAYGKVEGQAGCCSPGMS